MLTIEHIGQQNLAQKSVNVPELEFSTKYLDWELLFAIRSQEFFRTHFMVVGVIPMADATHKETNHQHGISSNSIPVIAYWWWDLK